jgi:hypothetical protein
VLIIAPPFSTSELCSYEWSASPPTALPQGKLSTVPIGYEAGWAPEPVLTLCTSWACRESKPNSSAPARRYTDWSIPASVNILNLENMRNVFLYAYLSTQVSKNIFPQQVFSQEEYHLCGLLNRLCNWTKVFHAKLTLLGVDCVFGLLFGLGDGGITLLWNVGIIKPDNTPSLITVLLFTPAP